MKRSILSLLMLASCVGDSPAGPDGSTGNDASTDTSTDTIQQGEAGPFDANFYGNLELWVSADVGVTQTGGKVTGWQDRSTQHRNITATVSECASGPTVTASAIHGLPALDFDGATECLAVSGAFTDFTLGFTAYVVLQPGNCNSQFTGNAGAVFDSSDNTSFSHADAISINRNYTASPQTPSGDGMLSAGGGAMSITGGSSWVPATPAVLEFRFPAAAGGTLVPGTAYVNGQFQNNLNPNNPQVPQHNASRTTTIIGEWASNTTSGNQYYCGMIGEMLVFSKALPDADRQAVETYLKTRWSL